MSHFDALLTDQASTIRYRTRYLPSGGLGIAWTSPHNRLLIGTRVILNNDWEERIDAVGNKQGLYRNYEYRLGHLRLALARRLSRRRRHAARAAERRNDTHTIVGGANLGVEQSFFNHHVVVRGGVDECQFGLGAGACTPTAGLTFGGGPVGIDFAYLYNLGQARIGTLFGVRSHSVLATLNFDYGWFLRRAARGRRRNSCPGHQPRAARSRGPKASTAPAEQARTRRLELSSGRSLAGVWQGRARPWVRCAAAR